MSAFSSPPPPPPPSHHVGPSSPPDKSCICPVCKVVLSSIVAKNRHLSGTHHGHAAWPCDNCGLRLKTEKALQKHKDSGALAGGFCVLTSRQQSLLGQQTVAALGSETRSAILKLESAAEEEDDDDNDYNAHLFYTPIKPFNFEGIIAIPYVPRPGQRILFEAHSGVHDVHLTAPYSPELTTSRYFPRANFLADDLVS